MSTPAKDSKPRRAQADGNIAWLDLEMTGLDPERDVILQAALIITDRDLRTLEEVAFDVWQPSEALARMSPFVREMHEKTGLLPRVSNARGDVRHVEERLLAVVAGWCPYPAVLCGNSIWKDRSFLDRYMPGLSKYFHYRMLDVSALKVAAQTFRGPGALFQKPDAGKHEALADTRQSIAELRHYLDTLFAPVGKP